MLTNAWTHFRPHAIQAALWRSKKRFVAVAAGRGSGKTELAKRRLIRMLPIKKDWHDPKYFFGAPTEQQAKRISWEHLKALIPPRWLARPPHESELRIDTVFGSRLWVVGMDRPARIEGVQFDGCVIDESCDQKPKSFDLTVRPMLTHRNGWCWRIGVPKRRGPSAKEFRRFFERAEAGEIRDAEAFRWPSSDILPPEALISAQESMDTKDYREQFDAQFETAGGQLFYGYNSEYNVRPCLYDPHKPLIIGSDFNVDPMCWVIGHRYEDRLEFFDELFIRDTNTPQALEMLWQRYKNHQGGFEWYGDATGAARKTSATQSDYMHIYNHEGFKRSGRTIHYPNANPLRADRFASCNALLCNAAGDRRLFVDPHCTHLQDDLDARFCPPGSNEPADTGDLGHMTDAMGYVVHSLFPMQVEVDASDRQPEIGIVRFT